MSSRVIHFEIPADDPQRAVNFYTRVFDWTFQKWAGPQDYWLVTTGASQEPGINGGLLKRQHPTLSIATVYRTVRLFEEAGILERHEFGDGRSRYEAASETPPRSSIDVETGNVIEFVDDELEVLQKRIAEKLGFRLVDHRMELYGVTLDRDR